MNQAIIQIETHPVVLQYDENDPVFKATYESYTEVIDRKASVKNMLMYVAEFVQMHGTRRMIEGIGYVRESPGYCADEDLYSGISVIYSDSAKNVSVVHESR